MLTRKNFITNSSSTSFTAYGISINEYSGVDRIDVLLYLLENPITRALFIDRYVEIDELEQFGKDPREFIEEKGIAWEALETVLPPSLYIESPGDSTFYICMGSPSLTLHEDGTFSLDDPNQLVQGYKDLKAIIAGLELENTQISLQADEWWS